MFVTQAAISHQVKALEAALDLQLFRRLNRRLMLTDAGQLYLPALTGAFDAIDSATARLRADDNAGRLIVSVANSLAAKWLLPRLPRFRDRHPEFEVEISALDRLVDFDRDNVDMGVSVHRPSNGSSLTRPADCNTRNTNEIGTEITAVNQPKSATNPNGRKHA